MTTAKESSLPIRSVFDHQLARRNRNVRVSTLTQETVEVAGDVADSPHIRAAFATTANVDLSGAETVDGGTPTAGDVILVWQQTNATQNGPYLYNPSGAWERANVTIQAGMLVSVLSGALYGDHVFLCGNATDPVIGTDSITFADVSKITGSGTANRVTKWTTTATIGDSQIADSGTYVSIPAGSASALGKLEVFETTNARSTIYAHNGAASTAKFALEAVSLSDSGYCAQLSATEGAAGLRVSTLESGSGIEVSTVTGTGVSVVPGGDGIALSANRNVGSATAALVDLHEDSATATGTTLEVTSDGLGEAATFQRNNVSATDPTVRIHQDAVSGNQIALVVTNDSVNAGHGVSVTVDAGGDGIGVAVVGSEKEAGFFYRPSTTTGTAPTFQIWQDSTTDTQDVLNIRSDGTGKSLVISDGGATNVLEVHDAGPLALAIGLNLPHDTYAANHALTAANYLARFNSAVAARTATLPAASVGKRAYLIARAGGSNVTIARTGTDTINGAGANQVIADGSLWYVHSDGVSDWFAKQIA